MIIMRVVFRSHTIGVLEVIERGYNGRVMIDGRMVTQKPLVTIHPSV